MADVHIASFIVQHRVEAAAALDACIDGNAELSLARRDGSRSIVLCESDDPRALMERIDQLRDVHGVLQVSLVYHHVEADDSLDQPLGQAAAPPSGPGVPA
ncbi:chaperone NapD [Lysobacter sp. SG-8]|uniref:Chaperone NapD n=1 Tax=Marilutibacter penaei TaxID=2759900 RepID=A0A7W3U3J9_9GAMM|nr:chaperone NapD [Lysobacter penaei]